MEHLTDFELILVGASVATYCFGFNTFIKNVYLKNFKTTKKRRKCVKSRQSFEYFSACDI